MFLFRGFAIEETIAETIQIAREINKSMIETIAYVDRSLKDMHRMEESMKS